MGFLSDFFKDPFSTVHETVKGSIEDDDPTRLYDTLSWIPGSPEGAIQGLYEGFKEDRSWNPYDPNEASVWDRGAGGEWSTDPEKRAVGRMVGTAALGMTGSAALSPYLGQVGAGAATGASLGAAQTAGAGGDRDEIGKGAIRGGLQGGGAAYLNGLNPAGYVGITDPALAAGFNGFVSSGVTSAAADSEDWRKDATKGGVQAMIPYVGSYLSGMFGSPDSYSPTTASQGLVNNINQQSRVPDQGSYFSKPETNSYVPQSSSYAAPSYTPGAPKQEPAQPGSFQMPELGKFFESLVPKTSGQWGDLAQGLAGMYAGYQQRRDARDLQRQFMGNREAYVNNLRQQLQRRDAASGRRSNYSGRETELMAQLAKLDSQNLPAMQALKSGSTLGTLNMLTSALRYGGNMGAFGPAYTRDQGKVQPLMNTSTPTISMPQINEPSVELDSGNLADMFRRNRVVGGY